MNYEKRKGSLNAKQFELFQVCTAWIKEPQKCIQGFTNYTITMKYN